MTAIIPTALLAAHTFFHLYSLALRKPVNVFAQHAMSVTAPTDLLRSVIRDSLPHNEASQILLTRMGSMKMRLLYLRFGHYTLSTCPLDVCHTTTDFFLYLLPSFSWNYLSQTIWLHLLNLPPSFVGALPILALIEAFLLFQGPQSAFEPMVGEYIMWHDWLLSLRLLLFLCAPLIGPLFRSHAASPSGTLSRAAEKLVLVRHLRGAAARLPVTAAKRRGYWEAERRDGAVMRAKEHVTEVLVRGQARSAVRAMMAGIRDAGRS